MSPSTIALIVGVVVCLLIVAWYGWTVLDEHRRRDRGEL
jgi:hypothetical protein